MIGSGIDGKGREGVMGRRVWGVPSQIQTSQIREFRVDFWISLLLFAWHKKRERKREREREKNTHK